MDALVVRALAHHARGDADSRSATSAGPSAAVPRAGYARVFLDEGPAMAELLAASRGAARTGPVPTGPASSSASPAATTKHAPAAAGTEMRSAAGRSRCSGCWPPT